MRPIDVFRMPTPVSVLGRSSSITNSFINGIIPAIQPTNEEVAEALAILGLTPDDLRCCYCGDKSSEWDHLRPLIVNREPTGFISEIQNLVPACGKCNQSKGNTPWEEWMRGSATLCPAARGVSDLEERLIRLKRFEQWRPPTQLDIPALIGADLWARYRTSWEELREAMRRSDELSREIKQMLRSVVIPASGSATRRMAPEGRRAISSSRSPGDQISVVLSRIREWAAKPNLNVHRIIAIVVRAGGRISRGSLVREAERVTGSRNAHGAVASLLTNSGNAYGRVFQDVDGTIVLHPDVEQHVRALNWSL